MTDNIVAGDGREFWHEYKRICGSFIPKCFKIDGTSGNASTAALFAKKYEDIYNTSRNIMQDISHLQDAIDFHIAVENSIDLSVVEVSEVTDGIKSLKREKWDGSEGMTQINYSCRVKYFVNTLPHYLSLCPDRVIHRVYAGSDHSIYS